MGSASDHILRVEQLSKSFGSNHVLDNVSFSLIPGESLAVLGKSGAGKSVLFKCITGLLAPDSGEVWMHGQRLSAANQREVKELRKQVAVVFQHGALFDSLPVWRNVMFAPLMHGQGLGRAQARDQAVQLLAQVDLSADILDLAPASLSGGMQKRVAIARALAQQPKLVFFDEPTTGLDPITAANIDQLIARVVAQGGLSAVTITHDLNTARAISSSALLLDEAKVAWQGSTQVLFEPENAGRLPDTLQKFLAHRQL